MIVVHVLSMFLAWVCLIGFLDEAIKPDLPLRQRVALFASGSAWAIALAYLMFDQLRISK